jgi:hypothetical protein
MNFSTDQKKVLIEGKFTEIRQMTNSMCCYECVKVIESQHSTIGIYDWVENKVFKKVLVLFTF